MAAEEIELVMGFMPEATSTVPDRKPMNGKCDECGHVWTVAWLPMDLLKAAKLMQNACCPSCASSDISLAGSAR